MNRMHFRKRVTELSKRADITERAASLAAGLGPDFIREIRVGKNKSPSAEALSKIATVLNTTVDDLIGGPAGGEVTHSTRNHGAFETVPVVGEVQAGIWREAVPWGEMEIRKLTWPADPNFPGVARFGLDLIGNSMDREFPHSRTTLICIRFMDIEREPAHGNIVVVQRQRHDLVEATCKVYMTKPDGSVWLEPRSSDPSHRPIRMVRNREELADLKRKQELGCAHSSYEDHPRDLDTIEVTALVTDAWVRLPL